MLIQISSEYDLSHNIWLRDHCRCPSCYHPKTKQRLLNTFAISPKIRPISVEATNEGLQILWPLEHSSDPSHPEHSSSSSSSESAHDSHAALYPWKWLRMNSYAPPLHQTHSESITYQEEIAGPGKTLWGSGIAAHPPSVGYEEVMKDDRGVWNWLEKISQYGFSFVDNVPPTPEATEELIRRIAFIRETHYGGFWDFTSDLSHGDTAYTDLALGAHTDTTYFTDPAGLQLFHLLSHEASTDGAAPSGGASLLVDGFLAAKVLKDVHPEAYDVLSTVRISTHSAGDENTFVSPLLKAGYPILQHDFDPAAAAAAPISDLDAQLQTHTASSSHAPPHSHGKLVMVRYNNDDRSVLSLPESLVEPFYSALNKWHSILTSSEGEYWQQLTPGRCLIFDNHRVLHGRSAFVGQRRLCGGYVSGDDYRSRLEVLKKRYGGSVGSGSGSVSGRVGEKEGPLPRSVWDEGL
ncbi:Trimethyllysine dioxygenase [Microstroma glucosiphilum]|uniref:trimethyllysine dioxygenase n=1 Tax=Pseudomicrostroma glucosiphilum TaxID=1684307 RepID=A0A316U1G3_9BASI|nr:Trimethyllysine dioxygenase [Pseudomicrostroma glucosiphilum]PWN19040.1 Trimethyllysine dioxygenase [Pseudomicrostroma glucosiphilum]